MRGNVIFHRKNQINTFYHTIDLGVVPTKTKLIYRNRRRIPRGLLRGMNASLNEGDVRGIVESPFPMCSLRLASNIL
jgi:hypothetical protein